MGSCFRLRSNVEERCMKGKQWCGELNRLEILKERKLCWQMISFIQLQRLTLIMHHGHFPDTLPLTTVPVPALTERTLFFGRIETEVRIFRVIGFHIICLAGQTIFYIFHVNLFMAVLGIDARKFNVEKMIAIKLARMIFLLCISCTLPIATTSNLRARFISFGMTISAVSLIENDQSNSLTRFSSILDGRIEKFA